MADTERFAPPDPSGALARLGAARARAGEDLLTELLATSLPALRAYARKLCGDATLADDCVQDACVRALSAAWSLSVRPVIDVAAACAAVAGALAGLGAAAGEAVVAGEPGAGSGRPVLIPPWGSRCSVAVSRLPSTHSA